MKYIRYFAIAIFTFVIGVGISPIRFDVEMIACGPHSSSTSYRSSYFMQTLSSYFAYDSEAEASAAFTGRLSKALNVIEVKPKVNKKGVLIEQRAVAVFYHEKNDEYYVIAFWRDGKVLHSIRSRSFTHVMDFEKHNF